MQLINRAVQILVVAFFTVPVSAYADSWSCSHDNNVREVHIERTTSEPVPCNVVYKKQTEGVEDQILWSANSDETYCEEKANELVAKLESWGWVCAETISDAADDSNEEAATDNDAGNNSTEGDATTGNDAGNNSTEGDAVTGNDADNSNTAGDAATGSEP